MGRGRLFITIIKANTLRVGNNVPDTPTVTKHTVTFNANGGTSTTRSVQVEHNSTLASIPQATRDEYSFNGWYDQMEGGNLLTTRTRITNDITYYAQWTIEEHDDIQHVTLTFDGNGNGQSETREILHGGTYNGSIGQLPEYTMTGHSLVGWYDSPTGGNEVYVSTIVDHDMTVYAHWNINQYTITFNANGGEGGWSRQMNYGERIIVPTVSWNGHVFSGWSSPVPDTVPEGGATYTAQWQINQYTATFDANDGDGSTVKTQNYGTSLSAPTVTRTGYTFTGWSPSVPETMPASNNTYTAQWQVNQYTVTFDANGGTGGTSITQDYGTSLASTPTVSKTGYTFNGWQPEVPHTIPAENTTCTAQWTPIEYTISYDMNGHGVSNPNNLLKYTVETGEYTPEPLEDVEGWRFEGWTPTLIPEGSTGEFTFTSNWIETKKLTRVKYTQASGITPRDQTFDISGELINESIPNKGKIEEIDIGSTVTSIGGNTFRECSSLTSVTIGNGVTSIGSGAFSQCSSLTSVHITDLAKWCGISFGNFIANPLRYAHDLYLNGEKVTALTIPDSVTSIENYAFYCYYSLTNVTIPNSVTNIGKEAFSFCTNLTSVTIPDSVTSIGMGVFRECVGLTSVTIGNGVTNIEASAFQSCSGLTSMTIPNGVTSIGNLAFANCSGLTGVTIPNSVTSIGYGAFEECSGLTSVTIPSSVTSIGYGMFFNCSNCTIFDFRKSASVPTLENVRAFQGTLSNKKIIVPDSLYDSWKAASNWSSTTNNIVNCIVKASEYEGSISS